jgi:hypothetical protein
MKHLILFYGRTGSTIVYSSILDYYSLVRGNTSELHPNNFIDTTDWLADKDDWVMKMHINTGITDPLYNINSSNLLEYFIDKEKPDNIYFSYREDIFDTYLSYAVSRNSDIWNSDIKHEYTHIGTGSDLLLECAEELEIAFERWYTNQDRLFDRYNIIPVSYEDIIKTDKITNNLPVKTLIVKQNSLEEKLSLFEDKKIIEKHFNNHLKKYSWDNGRIVK